MFKHVFVELAALRFAGYDVGSSEHLPSNTATRDLLEGVTFDIAAKFGTTRSGTYNVKYHDCIPGRSKIWV